MSLNFRNLDIIDWEFEETDSTFLVHNACWYPAKLIAQIPAHLILSLSQLGDIILDPFCGSGTTLIESLRHGRKCIGTDINPIAVYISKAKCEYVDLEVLQRAQLNINTEFGKACTFLDNTEHTWPTGQVLEWCEKIIEEPDKHIPNYEENSKWFHPVVLNKLYILKKLIYTEKPIVRDTLSLVFFSILRNCASLPLRKPYTYIADNVKPRSEDIIVKDVLQIYRERSTKLLVGRKVYNDQCRQIITERKISVSEFNKRCTIKRIDARNLADYIETKVDCVVTSPPYMGVTDTTAAHRLWYLWHDFGSTLEEDRKIEIGARWKRKKSTLLTEYLEDFLTSFKQVTSALKDGGYLCLIIGEPERAKGKILDTIVRLMHDQLALEHKRTYKRMIHKKWFEHPTGGVAGENIYIFQKT